MDPMKRFVEERKRTLLSEKAKLHKEHEAIAAYLNSVIEKADVDCQELLDEVDCDSFRKKCVPLLNWLQEKYDNLLLIRSFCLPPSESDACEAECLQSSPLSGGITEKLNQTPEIRYEAPRCGSIPDSLTPEIRYEAPGCGSIPDSLPLPTTQEPIVSPAIVIPDLRTEGMSKGSCSSVSDSLLNEPTVKPRVCCSIPKYEVNEMTMSVMPTCFISPWLFWVQVKPCGSGLEDLLEGLTCYNQKLKRGDPNYRLTSKPEAGQIVAAQFTDDSMWYRAIVLAVFEAPVKPGKKRIEVDVGYVDYGNTERLPFSSIRPIHERFTKLPFQAFVCSLTQIAPVESSGLMLWPDKVQDIFYQLDCSNIMTIRFSKPVTNCPIMFVDILDPQSSNSPTKVKIKEQPTYTEFMVAKKHAMLMPNNDHIAKWYWEKYGNIAQTAKPGETMISSLTQQDFHSTLMPIVGKNTREDLTFCKSRNDPSLSDANKNDKYRGERQVLHSNTNKTQALKIDQNEKPSVGTIPSKCPMQNKASVQHSDASQVKKHPNFIVDKASTVVSQSYSVTSMKGNCARPTETLTATKQSTQNDGVSKPFPKTDTCVASQSSSFPSSLSTKITEVGNLHARHSSEVVPAGLHDKMPLKSDSFSSFSVSDAAVFMSQQLPNDSSCSYNEPYIGNSRKDGTMLRSRTDHFKGSSSNVVEVSAIVTSEILPNQTADNTLGDILLQKQKLIETQAYVDRLAESGWPERIAQAAMCQMDQNFLVDHCLTSNGLQETPQLQIDYQQLSSYSAHGESFQVSASISNDCPKTSSTVSHQVEKPIKVANVKLPEGGTKGNLSESKMNPVLHRIGKSVSASENVSCTTVKYINSDGHKGRMKPKNTVVQITSTVCQLVVPAERYICIAMAFIESPSKFWIHIVDESAKTIDYIENEIDKHVNSFSLSDDFNYDLLLTDPVVRDYGLCCARSKIDGKVYRAELVDACIEPSRNGSARQNIELEVFYIDFGNTEWIPLDCFVSMPPFLVNVPPLAICCMLDGVEPVSADDGCKDWSSDAVEVFADICGFTKALIGNFPTGVKAGDVVCFSRDHPIRLLLVDSNSYTPIAINEQLITLGFARASRKYEETRTVDEEEGDEMDNWDPMAEDFLSYRNSYKVDVDDAGVATVSYKALDERRICRFYNSKRSRCWKGDDCPFEHIAYEGVVTTTDRREVFGISDAELQLELPLVDSWVIVNVTCIVNPSKFFVVLPFGNKSVSDMVTGAKKCVPGSQPDEGYDDQTPSPMLDCKDSLDYLMNNLQECYKSKVYIDSDLIAYTEGEIVVVRFTRDERWHRARILASEPDLDRVQVLYVDFGNNEWVTLDRVRQIEMEFLYLPFQAIECNLSVCGKNGEQWSDIAIKFFISSTEGKYLVAHVLQRSLGSVLHVDLYDTNGKELNVGKALLQRGYARIAEHQTEFPIQHSRSLSYESGSDKWNQQTLIPG